MKTLKPLVLGVLSAALVTGLALPASADTTTTTFQLTGGALSMTHAPTAALGNSTTGDTSITGSLGTVTVTDARGGTTAWDVSLASTAFTGALQSPSTSTAVAYTAGVVTETGTITVADGVSTTVSTTAVDVVSPSAVSGNNTASWNPTLDVTMPAGALVDTYTGTVTTSVA